MHALLSTSALLVPLLTSVYESKGASVENSKRYVSISRYTDPKSFAPLLDDLPDDVGGILHVVKRQVIHPDLQVRANIPERERKQIPKIWPPRLTDILKALQDAAPHNLRDARRPGQRVVGACILRSYFVASLLRYRLVPARVRAGYLTDASAEGQSTVDQQEKPDQEKGSPKPGDSADTAKGERESDVATGRAIEINRYSEHWACECWDGNKKRWRLLDIDGADLEAHRASDSGRRHFEFACEMWKRIRRGEKIYPDDFEEASFDHRSRVRSQLLWDFASLLNHDLAGCDEPSANTRKFLEERKYSELSSRELQELDRLADLLSRDPVIDELVAFYRRSATLRLESAENDPYSYVFR
jgi:hypothetical protein